MTSEKLPKLPKAFECKLCDFICYNKKDYKRHLDTRKHTITHSTNENNPKIPIYACDICANIYKHSSSLCKHKKQCKPVVVIATPSPNETQSLFELMKELVKSNQEIQKQMIELCKNGIHNTTNTITNTNSNNKSFNLNLFLNETCKNAINFKEFVENIEVSREDLTNTGQVGFVSGISKILIDHLKELGIHERPIHCTDLKRDIVYIKDNNEWNKEENDLKIRSAIQEVSRKSMGTLYEWKQNNPEYVDVNSKFSNECITMQRNSVAGYERDTLFPRVCKELSRAVTVSKDVN
jgi:hypothetical protein